MLPELLQGGRYESSGTFSLDLGRAARKLGRYQSDEPLFFLLKFVQAAVAAGATCLRIHSRGELVAEGGESFELTELAGFSFDEQPFSYLGLGVGAALAAGATRVVCRVGSRRLIATGEGSRVEPGPCEGFRVTFAGLPPVTTRLRERVAYAPIPVWLDAECLNFVSTPVATRVWTDLEDPRQGVSCAGGYVRKVQRHVDEFGPGCGSFQVRACTGLFRRGEVTVPVARAVLELRDPKLESRMVLVKHGVTLSSSPALGLPGALCVVSAQGLQLDASTLQVVEDASLEALVRGVERDLRLFYTELVQVFAPSPGVSWERVLVVLLGLVVFLVVVACILGGEGPSSGCDFTGGWGASSRKDKLREQLLEILRA